MTDLLDDAVATIEAHSDVVARTDTLSREEWLELRRSGIGGSDAAGALGLSPWASPFSVWADKVGNADDDDTERFRWGRRLERSILEGFGEDTGIPVVAYPMMLRSREWPWMCVNLDGIAPSSVVEVKNVGVFMAHEWKDGAVPTHYVIQGAHANAVTGLPGCHFAPLIGGNQLRPVYVARNDALIETLVEAERQFWDLVQSETPPEVDGLAPTTEALKRVYGEPDVGTATELPVEALGLIDQRAALKATMATCKGQLDEIENHLRLWLGRAEIGNVNGVTVVTWKASDYKGYYVEPRRTRRFHFPKPPKS